MELSVTSPALTTTRPGRNRWPARRGGEGHDLRHPTDESADDRSAGAGGDPLRSPNDIALDGHAGFYFTDPGSTQADYDARSGRVYYVDSDRVLHLAATDFRYCNGIVVRPDGRALFIDDTQTNEILAFDIVAPGQLANRRVFAVVPGVAVLPGGLTGLDGMTFNKAGRLCRPLRRGAGGRS